MAENFIEVREEEGISIATLQIDAITAGACLNGLQEELLKLCPADTLKTVVLNFRKVEFLCSGAVGLIMTMNRQLRSSGGRLVLCSVQPNLLRIFHLMQLHEVLIFANDEGEAIKRALNPLT